MFQNAVHKWIIRPNKENVTGDYDGFLFI